MNPPTIAHLPLPSGLRSRALRRDIAGYLAISPWLIGFLAFQVFPLLLAIYLCFVDWTYTGAPVWVGLGNFREMFSAELFYKSLGNTAYYTFIAVGLQVGTALIAALAVNQKIHAVNFYRFAFYLPSIVPSVGVAYLWMWIYNPEFGLLNAVLRSVGLPGQRWLYEPSMAKMAYIFMSLWGIGGGMVIFLAGLQGIPDLLYEAAEIDGAGRWSKFWNVTIPMLSPIIFFNLVMNVIGSFQIFTAAYLMTAGSPQNSTLFYVLYLYRSAFEDIRFGYASALAWALFLIILGFTVLQFKLSGRWVYYESEGDTAR